MNQNEYIQKVVGTARSMGYRIETNRNNQLQIDFGSKKLHEGHLRDLYPEILKANADISNLIDRVAPGRPCAHRPMKEIMSAINLSSR
jgi:hypothetical protein